MDPHLSSCRSLTSDSFQSPGYPLSHQYVQFKFLLIRLVLWLAHEFPSIRGVIYPYDIKGRSGFIVQSISYHRYCGSHLAGSIRGMQECSAIYPYIGWRCCSAAKYTTSESSSEFSSSFAKSAAFFDDMATSPSVTIRTTAARSSTKTRACGFLSYNFSIAFST